MVRKLALGMMLVLLLFMAAGCGNAATASQSAVKTSSAASLSSGTVNGSPLTIKMLDVGQGDALLIRTTEQTILIDTGDLDEHEKLQAALKKENVTTVDKLIITHPHADHLGGASVVFRECTVKEVYDNGEAVTPKFYRDYLKTIKSKGIAYKVLADGDVLDFGGGVTFRVLSPVRGDEPRKKDGKPDLNNNSIVGQLQYGEFSMLFTGDCEAEYEKKILSRYGNRLKSTVLKAPHHGSKTSSSLGYLKAVRPEAALISCGAGNDYGHPHKTTLNRYAKLAIKIWRTDLNGTITVTSDGNTYDIKGEQ